MNESSKGMNKAIIGLIVVVLLVAAASAVLVISANVERDEIGTASNETAKTSAVNDTQTQNNQYTDGDYSARGSYLTPGGNESIDLMLTLQNGVVTDTNITQNAETQEAKEFQERFASGYKEQVVGKSIDEISLDRVAGSSLTPIGFNSALADIKDDARA
jgi:uncharacterized protein with FMN-binding domain